MDSCGEKGSGNTVKANWGFIWALTCESSLDWQIREIVFLSSSATRGLYPGVLVGYTAKIETSSREQVGYME